MSSNQTRALSHFLDDHVKFGDVAQNYSLILKENEVEGCELRKNEFENKNESIL